MTVIYPSGFASTGLSAAAGAYSDHTAATMTSQQTKAGGRQRHVIICQPQRQHHTSANAPTALPRLNAICPPAAPNNLRLWHFAVTIFAEVLKGQIIRATNKSKNKRRCFHAAAEKGISSASTMIKSVTAAMRSGENVLKSCHLAYFPAPSLAQLTHNKGHRRFRKTGNKHHVWLS